MARINAAACVTPINLVGLVLLATPRQSMGEADLVRQLELYASLLRQAPYSPRVWVTGADGASMLSYAESMRVIQRRAHELGDIIQMTEESSVLTRPLSQQCPASAAHAVADRLRLSQQCDRTEIRSAAPRVVVYPYVAEEYFLRWTEDEIDGSSRSCSRTSAITVS